MSSYLADKAIGSNSGHIAADTVRAAITMPFVDIADGVADAALAAGATTVGLVGTRPVMEDTFYSEPLARRELTILTPPEPDPEFAHHIVFNKLAYGIFTGPTKDRFVNLLHRPHHDGAQAIVLGCTEYSLIIQPDDVADLSVLDTTTVHVEAVVRAALGGPEQADVPRSATGSSDE